MEAYSLNSHIIPGKPLPQHEHKKLTTIFVVVLAIAAALSLWYLWVLHTSSTTQAPANVDLRSQVADLLKQAPVHASQAEIDQVTALLSKSKAGTVTSAEQDAVARLLKK